MKKILYLIAVLALGLTACDKNGIQTAGERQVRDSEGLVYKQKEVTENQRLLFSLFHYDPHPVQIIDAGKRRRRIDLALRGDSYGREISAPLFELMADGELYPAAIDTEGGIRKVDLLRIILSIIRHLSQHHLALPCRNFRHTPDFNACPTFHIDSFAAMSDQTFFIITKDGGFYYWLNSPPLVGRFRNDHLCVLYPIICG